MKIAVIVYSKTGTTLKLAKLFKEKLEGKNHAVDLVELATDPDIISGTAKHHTPFSITNLPDAEGYDALLVGGPVWAFSASPVIYEAVGGLKNVSGKKVLPFVTQGFPFTFLGGKQAIGLMSKELTKKGADVLPGISVPGMNREKRMKDAASDIDSIFWGENQQPRPKGRGM
ncbi:MAG: flavodoxin family protein [Candidatus Altiarchaeota archaeon]|nr:flavodoxin family protein [Candidatus Altiarchaeota archaeon]